MRRSGFARKASPGVNGAGHLAQTHVPSSTRAWGELFSAIETRLAYRQRLPSYRLWGTNAGRTKPDIRLRYAPLGSGMRMGWGIHLAVVPAARGVVFRPLPPASSQFE
jgi:hypothetical protein